MIRFVRRRMAWAVTDLFAHVPNPLENTQDYKGDPGLFGPTSVSWRVIGDVATMVGGIRALLIQSAHQEVAAGIADHSLYQDDPLGRLSRTSAYVTATAFGALPEVDVAVMKVRRAHLPVSGESHRMKGYDADNPAQAAWVHNVLVSSFLTAHQKYGKDKLDRRNADRFVAEQVAVGRLLDANPTPRTADVLADWVDHHPDIGMSPGMVNAVDFLRRPPLPLSVRVPYRILFWAAVGTIPVSIRSVIGIRRKPGMVLMGKIMVKFLRWVLGSSPAWRQAVIRVDEELPEHHRFRDDIHRGG